LRSRFLLVSRGLRSNQFRDYLALIIGKMLLALPEKLVQLTSKVSEDFLHKMPQTVPADLSAGIQDEISLINRLRR